MSDFLQQIAGQQYGGVLGTAGAYVTIAPKLTKREALTQRLERNQKEVERLTAENAEIEEALGLLDQSPLLERFDNLITKVLGR